MCRAYVNLGGKLKMSAPISARNDGSNYAYSVGPDVCWTPIGSYVLPIPYFSIAYFDPADRTSRTVRNNDLHDFQLNTRATKTKGHEAGTKKGVAVPGHEAISHAMRGSATVFSEGFAVVRDGDPARVNRPDNGSTEPKRSKKAVQITYFR